MSFVGGTVGLANAPGRNGGDVVCGDTGSSIVDVEIWVEVKVELAGKN